MRDESGRPQTKHTTAAVPLVVVNAADAGDTLDDGILADVAPTICVLMGIPTPPFMTGHSLLGGEPGTTSGRLPRL